MRENDKLKGLLGLSGFAFGLLALVFGSLSVWAQEAEIKADSFDKPVVVKGVVVGPHPEYSRVLIPLSDPVSYEIKADFLKRRVILTLNNAVLGPRARSRVFQDRNLTKVGLNQRQKTNTVDIVIQLRNRNSRFFHFLKNYPNRIIVDVKGSKKPFPKSRFKLPKAESLKVVGYTKADILEANIKDRDSNLKNGREEYSAALKAFQEKHYEDAIKLFEKFQKRYPKSIYSEPVAYLIAQSEFNIEVRKTRPIYDKALNAYNYAIRKFPKSKFSDHARTRLAFIYDQMDMVLEAKTLYEQKLQEDPQGLYAKFVQTQLSLLLLKEKRYEEALIALRKVLEVAPDSLEAREGVFKVGKWYYDEQDFGRALDIFEYIERQAKKDQRLRPQERFWDNLMAEKPEINFLMAEIYFHNKGFKKAREHYFTLLNLDPKSPAAHRARNRIGDSYFIEKNDSAAIAVFDESTKTDQAGRESQYGMLRIADIGIRNPGLKINDMTVNTESYFHPFKTYEKVIENAKDKGIMAEALLSRGIAFLRSQRYLEAMDQFKLLLTMKPEPSLVLAGKKYLKQSLIFLTDKFSRQGGHLPILYAYGDFLGMNLGDIDNVKTLFQIGEAYQSIGMHQQAVELYEKVKRFDTRENFRDQIFLNLGRIHLAQGNPVNAERVGKAFIKRFPQSESILAALELIGESLNSQNKPEKAITVYNDLLTRKFPEPARIHYKIGLIREDQNKSGEATAAYQKVLETYNRRTQPIPDYAMNSHYRFGGSLYNDKRYPQAIKALKTARELFPDHHLRNWADYLITQAYSKTQDENAALAEMKSIVESDKPDDLFKAVAQTNLKLLDWEKQFQDVL